MKINYLCNSWQYLLQQVVYMVGRGYYNYHVGTIPTDKVAKANKIDKKIIEKYKIDLSKDQRARRKKKKLANFYYLRWENQFIILYTDGQLDVTLDDTFYDVRLKQKEVNKLKIKVSEYMEFNVVMQNKKDNKGKRSVTVCMSNDSYKELRANIDDIISHRQIKRLEQLFKNLRGLPAWQGVIKQEYKLLEEVYKDAKKYGLNTKKKNLIKYPKQYPNLDLYPLRINTFRKTYSHSYYSTNTSFEKATDTVPVATKT